MTDVLKKGSRVQYRTRWDRDNVRFGAVGRIAFDVMWIGCHCFHINDLIALREVE